MTIIKYLVAWPALLNMLNISIELTHVLVQMVKTGLLLHVHLKKDLLSHTHVQPLKP